MNANQTIILARKHVGTNSSARLCLSDAIRCYEDGLLDAAKNRALDSLKHSVGVFHPDYKAAIKPAKAASSRYVMNDGYNVEFLGARPAKCGEDY